jgi:hypothetical protein
MLSPLEHSQLLHDIKRAAIVMRIIKDESSLEKQKVLLGLLSDEVDRLANDIEELKPS